MLDELINAKTAEDFMQVSRSFVTSDNRLKFFQEVIERDLILSFDALWTSEEVHRHCSNVKAIMQALASTEQDKCETKIVHRLQLVAGCNPAAKRAIESFLMRTCV